MKEQEIHDKVKDIIIFTNDNPRFKKNLEQLMEAFNGKDHNLMDFEFLISFVKINDGKMADNLLKRWKELLVEQN